MSVFTEKDVEAVADAIFRGGVLDEVAAAGASTSLREGLASRDAGDDAATIAQQGLDALAPRLAERERVAREALEEIVRHADFPAGEPWERAYAEVTTMARAALEDLDGGTT